MVKVTFCSVHSDSLLHSAPLSTAAASVSSSSWKANSGQPNFLHKADWKHTFAEPKYFFNVSSTGRNQQCLHLSIHWFYFPAHSLLGFTQHQSEETVWRYTENVCWFSQLPRLHFKSLDVARKNNTQLCADERDGLSLSSFKLTGKS